MLRIIRKSFHFNGLSTRFSSDVAGGLMKDEYNVMDSSGKTYHITNYKLESGIVLPEVQVR